MKEWVNLAHNRSQKRAVWISW